MGWLCPHPVCTFPLQLKLSANSLRDMSRDGSPDPVKLTVKTNHHRGILKLKGRMKVGLNSS